MSARAVVAVGEPFVPRGVSYEDADVARDEISSLRAEQEPIVLRVESPARGASSLIGDWLCDAGGADPVRLPRPEWTCSVASRAWARKRAWLDAWDGCPNGAWSIHAAALAGLPAASVVSAACACAMLLAPRPADVDPSLSRRVEETARRVGVAARWSAGAASGDEAAVALAEADDEWHEADPYDPAGRPGGEAGALATWNFVRSAWAVLECVESARLGMGDEDVAHFAKDAVVYASGLDFVTGTSWARRGEAARLLGLLADQVRRSVRTIDVLRAVAADRRAGRSP